MGPARFSQRTVGGASAGIRPKAATPEYNLIVGGITIREDRVPAPVRPLTIGLWA